MWAGLRRRLAVVLVVIGLFGACTSSGEGEPTAASPSPSTESSSSPSPSPSQSKSPKPNPSPGPKDPPARLSGKEPCANAPGFTCSTLRVPLDWSGDKRGKLDLSVAVAQGEKNDPVLLVLSGGPGQGGVDFASFSAQSLAPVLGDYRIVMLDQRGTGAGAIDCPELQAAVGGSDILAPPPGAVRSCAKRIRGERNFYTTEDTVADLDLLREALGAQKWTLDGISYGTFVAERYAISHPGRVRGLILDSVVPYQGVDPFLRDNLRRTAVVLRDVCKAGACSSDPAKDLAWIVRHEGNGVGILNAITLVSIFDPTFRRLADVPTILQEARDGSTAALDAFVAEARRLGALSSNQLSAGLHAATLCSDLHFPWDEGSTLKRRKSDLRRLAGRKISDGSVWPFDRATAVGNGVIQTCLDWPATQAPAVDASAEFPDVPVLLLQGERDLSTPVAWARRLAKDARRSRLVILPDDGHSTQLGEGNERPVQEIGRFLQRTR